jgi:FK506-binding nuclear protein
LLTTVSSRFEEIKDEEPSASKKRGRESDVMEVEVEEKSSKKDKKKNKKQKGENGKPVAAGAEASEKSDSKPAKANGETKPEKEGKKDKKKVTTTELPSGLKIADVTVGEGKAAKKGDSVSMRYIGKFMDGKIFDQNTKGKPVCCCDLLRCLVFLSDLSLVHFQARCW